MWELLIQAGVYTYFRIDLRAHARARTMSSRGRWSARSNWSRAASSADVDFIYSDCAHGRARAREWKNCLEKQKLRATESVSLPLILISPAVRPVYKPRSRVFDCSIARWNQPAGRISMLSPELRRAALNPDRAAKVGWKYRDSAVSIAQHRELTYPRVSK